jgi:hypothetical protein
MIAAIAIVFTVTLSLSLCFVLSGGHTRNNSQVQDIVDDVYENLHKHAEDNRVFTKVKKG